jgi:hypothetical protein
MQSASLTNMQGLLLITTSRTRLSVGWGILTAPVAEFAEFHGFTAPSGQ